MPRSLGELLRGAKLPADFSNQSGGSLEPVHFYSKHQSQECVPEPAGLGPIVDLIGAMETQSEPSELELDDVVITNPHIEAILENEDWIEDASGLVSHCIAILKICHTLTEKLVAMTMGSGAKMKTSASVSDIIVVAKRISPRVDDVVRSMYPPLDPKLLDARTTALLLSVSHLVLVTRNACHLTGGLDWIDQSLSAAEEHLEVLREAALASEPERGLPGAEGFLQEQSAI
uniref:Transmembrane protein 98 n=1 Tax=Sarcophilus harrisii TaxID=9305 RepID=A0A7N4P6Y7_SARHA